ncbi:hypothetical protein FRB98_002048 [Tulasnella sp. 332]|nr:hypothetical protein FRB98_002048 [Tulasnella sp. 332]
MSVNHHPHLALIIPELLPHYFNCLSDHELTQAAQVCATWAHVAEDELWRTREVPLDALLLKLDELELLWDDSNKSMIPSWTQLQEIDTEAILMEGWKGVIDNYAHKITRLHITGNIRRASSISERALALAFGPSLIDLSMEVHYARQMNAWVAAAGTFAPQIKRLVVRSPFGYWSDPLHIDCSTFCNLRVSRLGGLSWQGWKTLASCKRLEDVALTAPNQLNVPQFIPTEEGDRPTFPSLRRFRINNRVILVEVLRESIMPALEYLTLGAFMNLAGMKVMSLGEVGRRSPLLKGLTIGNASDAFGDIVEDMSSMRNLTSINITGIFHPDQLNDDCIKLIAAHHPHLEVLTLKPKKHPDSIGMTINSLLALIQHCMALRCVDIPLDLSELTRDISGFDFQALAVVPSVTVTKMAIGFVVGITNATCAAEFLAKLLPNVEELDLPGRKTPLKKSDRMTHLVEEFRQYRASQRFTPRRDLRPE